ncbi:MAG: ABC transporter substrate-binding protein [Planctomycetes bacterium]|nr:ABC transporter substrate-binding protein [Planctomycetota bacterium]
MRPSFTQTPLPAMVLAWTLALAGCNPAAPPTPAASQPIPTRIICIAPNATEMIGALGQADRLVGVSTFCLWPPEVKSLPRIGGLFDASAEAILKLKPDLIILRGANRGVEQICRDGNIRLYRDKTERFDDITRTLDELAAILGCPEKAREVRDTMNARLDTISRAVAGKPRPRVFITLARRPDSLGDLMTGSKLSFIHEVITRAGGENVFATMSMDYPRVSLEAILAAKPDVILEAMPETPESDSLLRSVREQWARVGPIPAVRSNRIHILHDENCLIPSPRIVDVIERIAHLLHPEADLARR